MDLSIIIVNWNTRDFLRDCLRSVYEQTKDICFEVIVIDNASTDGSATMVKEGFPQAILLENSGNHGFAAANNQGMAIANGRYLLLLNSDTLILDNAIAKAVTFADSRPQAAAVGCRVLNSDGTLQPTCFMFPSVLNMLLSCTHLYKIFPKNRLFGREYMTWWDGNDVREVDVVAGCFMLVRREAAQQVGMLDNRYFVYGEETDWSYRFKQDGWKTLYTPEAEIIHYGGQTSRQMTRKFRWQLEGSKLIFMRLHRSKLSFLIVRFLIALFLFVRVPYWLIRATFRKDERQKSFETAMTYLIGCFYCLADWKKLLMNRDAVTNRMTKETVREARSDY